VIEAENKSYSEGIGCLDALVTKFGTFVNKLTTRFRQLPRPTFHIHPSCLRLFSNLLALTCSHIAWRFTAIYSSSGIGEGSRSSPAWVSTYLASTRLNIVEVVLDVADHGYVCINTPN
jgi:hypothetical protein